jgi:hypothetical protein
MTWHHRDKRQNRQVDAAIEVAPLPNDQARVGTGYSSLPSDTDCRSRLLSAWRDMPSISAAMD